VILKTQKFRDQTLSSDAFKAWKSSLTDLGAQIVAKKAKWDECGAEGGLHGHVQSAQTADRGAEQTDRFRP
jgi:hypothetical protein